MTAIASGRTQRPYTQRPYLDMPAPKIAMSAPGDFTVVTVQSG